MFEKIIGNEEIKKFLTQVIDSKNVSHSYMFVGQSGIGKFMFAKAFAQAILCTSSDKRPCNTCKSCKEFSGGNNPDLYIINEEESIKNEQIRNMTKSALEKPIESERKVYIINNSNNMTKEAQNSLLKTLEEPPEYITIILIVNDENSLLNTIKSRCTKIKFNSLDDKELEKVLIENKYYENITKDMLKIFNGSIENAIMLKGKEQLYTEVKNAFTNIKNISIINWMNLKEKLLKDKEEINGILNYINVILSDLARESLEKEYINAINIVENTKDRLKSNCNYDMTIDNLLLKTWEEING